MPQPPRNMRQVGDRIDVLLAEVRAGADERTRDNAEELVALLVELYGAALERIVETIADDERAGPELLTRLAADDLVASLLVLHGLHPLDLETRVQQALDKVRPYLGSHAGGVDFLGVDDAGIVRLRLEGSCHGCPSSNVTVKLAIERAIEEAAPEITGIEVEGVAERPISQVISLDSLRRNGPVPNGTNGAAPDGWSTVSGVNGLRSGGFTTTEVAGEPIVVCRLATDFYAYRNACPACGGTWTAAALDGELLPCLICGTRYDVRLAGRSPERPDLHLEPLPLLSDDGAVRVALPAGVAR